MTLTRAEDREVRREKNRTYYERNKEAKKEYQRRYYRMMQKRERDKPIERRYQNQTPSTAKLEANLPFGLKQHIADLRAEYLRIPIHKRPYYPDFLEEKTELYYKLKKINASRAF